MPGRAPLARHPVALAGILLTTASAVVFLALLVAELAGLFNNPYAGLVVFVGLPALVVLGLLLIPLGMWLEHRRLVRHPGADARLVRLRFPETGNAPRAVIVIGLTAVNLAIFLLAGYGSLHYMESPSFCGQACHAPMHPQFTAWQDAPHSRVACAQCHIGEGGHAFVHYKLNGVRQLYHVVTGSYPRPIPGVADMRPAHEVCGTCHWSGKGFGDVIRAKREYADDEANTETLTILQMYVGGPGLPDIERPGDPLARRSTTCGSNTSPSMPIGRPFHSSRSRTRKGAVREYSVAGTTPDALAKGEARTMDCIDCHNVVAHRIVADAAAGGRRGDRVRPHQSWASLRQTRRRTPGGCEPFERRRGRGRHRRRAAEVLFLDRPRHRRVRHRCRGGAADDLPTECLSYDEGDVRNVS